MEKIQNYLNTTYIITEKKFCSKFLLVKKCCDNVDLFLKKSPRIRNPWGVHSFTTQKALHSGFLGHHFYTVLPTVRKHYDGFHHKTPF